jgi:ribosomal protein L30E
LTDTDVEQRLARRVARDHTATVCNAIRHGLRSGDVRSGAARKVPCMESARLKHVIVAEGETSRDSGGLVCFGSLEGEQLMDVESEAYDRGGIAKC